MIKSFVDLTVRYSKQLGWHTSAHKVVRYLEGRGQTNLTSQVLKAMDADYKQYGFQPTSFARRIENKLWFLKFNEKTTEIQVVVDDYWPSVLDKVLPSAVAGGVTVRVIHNSGRMYNCTPVSKRDAEPNLVLAYRTLSLVKDWYQDLCIELENQRECRARYEALQELMVAVGVELLPHIDHMTHIVENLGPLYDIQLPENPTLHQYEPLAKINADGDKHLRPNLVVRTSRTQRQVAGDGYVNLAIAYLTIVYYQKQDIEPVYVWVDMEESPYYEDSLDDDYSSGDYYRDRSIGLPRPTRLLPNEAVDAELAFRYTEV